jgi:replication-associated recombination protein RarA
VPTKLTQQLDYGTGYQYAQDERDRWRMECLPPSLADRTSSRRTDRGSEKQIKWRRRREIHPDIAHAFIFDEVVLDSCRSSSALRTEGPP